MQYIYSAMVLYSAGKDITEDAIAAILKAAGVEADAAKIKALVSSLEGVDIAEAIASASVMAAAPAAAMAGAAMAGATVAGAQITCPYCDATITPVNGKCPVCEGTL